MNLTMADPRDPDEIEDEGPLQEGDEGHDAGLIDDESGDDAQTGQEFETDQTQERVDRRSRRDDTLREEVRAAREHAQRVENELRQLQQAREQPRGPREETDEEFQAKIALLDSEQRMDAKLDRALKKSERLNALSNYANADRADKMTYDAKATVNPLYRKHAAAVEATMATARQRGMDINRETALALVIGQSALQNQGKVSPARAAGQARIASQQARTTGGRGDQGRDQQRQRRFAPGDMSPEAVRQRLESDTAYI
jgi:hypothetical protein